MGTGALSSSEPSADATTSKGLELMTMFITMAARDEGEGTVECVLLNGKKQKARPKGVNLKVS